MHRPGCAVPLDHQVRRVRRALLVPAFVLVAACGRGERSRSEPPTLVPLPTAVASVAHATPSPTPEPDPTPFPAAVVPPGLRHDRTGEAAAVRSIQRQLVAEGFAPGYPDGRWGTHTSEAFEEFERARDLPVDGLADPDALRALFGPADEIHRVRGVEQASPAREDARGSLAATLALGALGGLAVGALFARIGRARRVA